MTPATDPQHAAPEFDQRQPDIPLAPASGPGSPPGDAVVSVAPAGNGGSAALTGIFVILLLIAINQARDFLLPVVTALLLFFVFMPVQRRLQRTFLPAGLSAASIVLGLLLAISVLFTLLSGPASEAMRNLPAITEKVTERVDSLRVTLTRAAQELSGRVRETSGGGARIEIQPDGSRQVADNTPETETETETETENGAASDDENLFMTTASGVFFYLAEAPAMVAQVAFSLVLLYFLLSSSDLMYLKIVQSFDAFGDKRAAYVALRRIERNLGGYLGTVTLINAALGAAVGVSMWLLGMPVPLMFAVLAFALNFIPFLGAVAGVLLSGLVALLYFDELGPALTVAAVYFALTAIEGQLVTPMLLARRMRMNAVLVFASVAFWAWMWSALGMLIAVPLMVALRVIAEQVPSMHRLANFLSGEAKPVPPVDSTPVK